MTGRELKERVEFLGITQRKLAEKLGVTPQSVSAILTAKDVRTSTVERIAFITNKPIEFFFRNHSADMKQSEVVASGAGSVAVLGSHNVTVNHDTALLRERITMLEKLLDEKERLISVLMGK